MSSLRKNIFLTGALSSGKTIVIKKIIVKLKLPASGFYTEEERIEDRRVGFMMKTLALGGDDFISAIKKMEDLEIIEVGRENRDELPELILRKISGLLGSPNRTTVG